MNAQVYYVDLRPETNISILFIIKDAKFWLVSKMEGKWAYGFQFGVCVQDFASWRNAICNRLARAFWRHF